MFRSFWRLIVGTFKFITAFVVLFSVVYFGALLLGPDEDADDPRYPLQAQAEQILPGFVRVADGDLTELYRYAIYGGAECYSDAIDGAFYTYCTTPDSEGRFGGLYEIRPYLDGYEVVAINGKAMQHARSFDMQHLEGGLEYDIPELIDALMPAP